MRQRRAQLIWHKDVEVDHVCFSDGLVARYFVGETLFPTFFGFNSAGRQQGFLNKVMTVRYFCQVSCI